MKNKKKKKKEEINHENDADIMSTDACPGASHLFAI